MLQRHGTSRGGWTKHTSPMRVPAINRTRLTSGYIHQTYVPAQQ